MGYFSKNILSKIADINLKKNCAILEPMKWSGLESLTLSLGVVVFLPKILRQQKFFSYCYQEYVRVEKRSGKIKVNEKYTTTRTTGLSREEMTHGGVI